MSLVSVFVRAPLRPAGRLVILATFALIIGLAPAQAQDGLLRETCRRRQPVQLRHRDAHCIH